MFISPNYPEKGDVGTLAPGAPDHPAKRGMKTIEFKIPECCRGNYDTCPHKVQPLPKRDKNII